MINSFYREKESFIDVVNFHLFLLLPGVISSSQYEKT